MKTLETLIYLLSKSCSNVDCPLEQPLAIFRLKQCSVSTFNRIYGENAHLFKVQMHSPCNPTRPGYTMFSIRITSGTYNILSAKATSPHLSVAPLSMRRSITLLFAKIPSHVNSLCSEEVNTNIHLVM